MGFPRRTSRPFVALLTAGSMCLSPITPLLEAQTAAPAAKPADASTAKPQATTAKPPATTAKPAGATAAARPREDDGGWPRDYTTADGGALRIFQPQVASWDGQQKIVFYAAVSFAAKGAPKPGLGSVKLEASTSVAIDDRLVNFTDAKITESNFPTLSPDEHKAVVADLIKLVPDGALVIALDRVLAGVDKSQIIPKNLTDVKADPPPIFYSTTKAVLVNIDGEPIWSPIKGNDLKFAVNTNWDLFQDTPSKAYFLRYEKSWLTAKDVKGPWEDADTLPDSFKKLPDDGNWKDVKEALPGESLSSSAMPKVFVSEKPAELILLRGAPSYLVVGSTKLLWVNNTESDVFRLGKAGTVYFLVSGRWFSAPDFTGPWTFATQSLPEEFKKIPLSHDRSRVLASVPGTDQAAEAVLLAQVPQTATVNKKQVKAPEVQYDGGAPQFQPIEKTNLQRAANTDKDIIKVGDLYYMCFQGVWFMGKSPTGPWEATGSVPGEIYTIPASSPSHTVTYVTVQEDHDDTAVYVAAAAYTGMMIAWGCVVWGSGWYYPPYVGYGGYYPMYRPYYPTYGYHASYNPWTGAYSRGVTAYGPYGGAGVGARYNPRTGTYSRGAVAWGPGGARGAASAYNPRTGAVGTTRQGSNVYGSWGQTAVARGDQWASTSRYTNRATGTTTRVTQGSGGGAAATRNTPGPGGSGVARTGSGDVYAGRDGNVYRKESGGGWEQSNGSGGWDNVEKPNPSTQQRADAQDRASSARSGADSSTVNQLNRDSAARAEGAQRTKDYNATGGGRTSSSSYKPSSGGARSAPRGGGGRRR